jgi:hypothetical protein
VQSKVQLYFIVIKSAPFAPGIAVRFAIRVQRPKLNGTPLYAIFVPLEGDRIVQSLELWYGKAHPFSRRPEVSLFGQQ